MAVVGQSPARPKVHVLRSRRYDPELQADVSSVYGYVGACVCGWRGKVKREWSNACRELREHLESAHDGNQPKGGND